MSITPIIRHRNSAAVHVYEDAAGCTEHINLVTAIQAPHIIARYIDS